MSHFEMRRDPEEAAIPAPRGSSPRTKARAYERSLGGSELLLGLSLREEVKQKGPLPWQRVLHIARQAARDLADAHAAGVLHGELTPDDVVLLPFGEEHCLVKVIGIGTECAFAHDREMAFTSPEQARGDAATARSDLYALGAAIFFALTECPPFHAFEPAPCDIDASPRGSRAALEALVWKCLMRDPEGRPASASELVDALGAIAQAAAGADGPVSSVRRLGREPAMVVPVLGASKAGARNASLSVPPLSVSPPRRRTAA